MEPTLLAPGQPCTRAVECELGYFCAAGVCTNDTSLLEGGVAASMDAGVPMDAGPAPDGAIIYDAGPVVMRDAGPGGTDAGPGRTDAGPGGTDAGPPPPDAGPPDAGPPPPPDAGPPPPPDAGP